MGNDVRASFLISQSKWRAFDAHHNFQNFQKFSKFQNFKIFESFENLKTLKLKILKNFENFENFDARLIRVLSPNFFWDFDKWRARVISHKKLVPQIRASFTKDARAKSARWYARFTRGHKNQWKSSNGQLQCFYNGTSGALCWKRQKKNTKTRETKTQITQNFEKVWPI